MRPSGAFSLKGEQTLMDNVHLDIDAVLNDPMISTPTLALDFGIISQIYDRFTAAFPGGEIDYAMKANGNPLISHQRFFCASCCSGAGSSAARRPVRPERPPGGPRVGSCIRQSATRQKTPMRESCWWIR